MRDMNKQLLKEQNIQELIVAAKIISSILFGFVSGLVAYFAFNGIVAALVAAPLGGGLLIGVFFATDDHRMTIASILGVCIIGSIILAVMIRVQTETYASFFGFVGGLACVIAVVALIAIGGLFAQAANVNEATVSVESGTTVACIITFVMSLVVWFSCRSIVQSLSPTPIQIAVITPEEEQEAQKKFLNSPIVRKSANDRRNEEQNERELQKAKILAEREHADRVSENARLAKEELEVYFAGRVLAMAIAVKANSDVSKMVRNVTYYNKRARFTVADSWHLVPYQIRLQAAQDLGGYVVQVCSVKRAPRTDV